MIPAQVRTPTELKAARRVLGLSAEGLAKMVRVESGRTVRRWESGEREVPGPVTVIVETAMDFLRNKEEIQHQLDLLESGAMHSSVSWGNKMVDNTLADIARLKEARDSLDAALAILTRQTPGSVAAG